jgi:hypothetical protein
VSTGVLASRLPTPAVGLGRAFGSEAGSLAMFVENPPRRTTTAMGTLQEYRSGFAPDTIVVPSCDDASKPVEHSGFRAKLGGLPYDRRVLARKMFRANGARALQIARWWRLREVADGRTRTPDLRARALAAHHDKRRAVSNLTTISRWQNPS